MQPLSVFPRRIRHFFRFPLLFPGGFCIIMTGFCCKSRSGALSAGRMGGCRRTKGTCLRGAVFASALAAGPGVRALTSAYSPTSVSYTHLDVYKRQ